MAALRDASYVRYMVWTHLQLEHRQKEAEVMFVALWRGWRLERSQTVMRRRSGHAQVPGTQSQPSEITLV